MSKYVLFFALLISLTTSAQKVTAVKEQPPQNLKWDEQESFVNGFARVLQNSKFSFINKSGVLIHAVEFDGARNFKNHLAAVMKDDKWGFINELGELVIPFNYTIAYDFNENITGVFGNKRWWLINTKGEVVKALDITTFFGFNNGTAKINKNDRWGNINTSGDIVFEKNQSSALQNTPVPYNPNPAPLSNSVSICPDNIDFEFGSFLNWKCFIGKVDSVGTTNVITVNPSPPTVNRHTIYGRIIPSRIDAFGLFPTNPPDGSNFAVKLGNTKVGAEAERIRYSIKVPITDSNFSIKYDYAVVFQDPGHTSWTQPRFTVRVFDSAANAYVSCASFEYISTSNLPGFTRSTVDTGVIYKPWSTVFLSLRGYAGKTMFLEFTTADCVRKGHWGYAYVDVEKPCGQSIEMQYDCTAPNITTLTGPPGFQTYNWWNQAFSTLLGTGQQIVLNPGPAVNSIIWLEMIPYNSFGCTDTLAVKITGTFNANFGMSDTVGVCAPHTFTFYNRDLPSSSATWDFGDGTTGTGDTVTHTYTSYGNYIIKLNVVLPSGCIGTAIKTVTILKPVGSFSFDQAYYCNNETVRFDATVSSTDSLIWNFGDGTILHTLQTTVFHTYLSPGIYLPSLTLKSNNGCQNTVIAADTVKIELLKAGFKNTALNLCGSTKLNFTDTSYSFFGLTSRQWDFGDGTTGSGTNVSHTYTTTGTYTIRLIITGTSGCQDTISKPIFVKVNNFPIAAIVGDTVRCQLATVTFSSLIQSVDSVNYYNWTSSNGFSGSGNTFTVTFNTAGNFTIKLIAKTINGCADTITHSIRINATPNVVQPVNQSVCNGVSTNAVAFTGGVTGTVFSWTNNNPSIGLAAGGNGDIPSFIAINSGVTASIATITISPDALGCPGPAKTFTITVKPTPDVVQPPDQILCNNINTAPIIFTGVIPGTTYSWANDNTSIGLAASGTGNILPFSAKNNGVTPAVATITVTPIINGCPGPSKIFIITVKPTPDVILPPNQILCNGDFTAAINFSGAITGTSFTWTNTTPIIGLAASGTGNIPSFQAFSNGSSIANAGITVKPTANGCQGPSKILIITVYPTPSVVKPADQILCNNSNTAAITFTGTVSGVTYNWTNSNPAIGLAASGSGNIPSFTAVNSGVNNAIATITVTPTANGCPGASKTFIITVKPTPDMVQPADQLLCSGNFTSAINFSSTVAGTVFTWTNTAPSIGLASSGTGNIASFQALSNSNNTTTATITVNPSANGCPAASKTFIITVKPTPNVAQPADQILCNNGNTAAIIFGGSVPGTIYNWTNNNPSIGLAASGSGDIPSFTATSNGVGTAIAAITVTPTVNGCTGVPKVFLITVHPTPDVVQPTDQTLCNKANTAPIIFSGAVNGTTYNWTNSNTSIGLAATGSGNIASFTAICSGINTAVATITVTPTVNGCPGASKTFIITVKPTPDVVQPTDQVLCDNFNTAAISFAGAVTGTTYNWTNSNSSIGLSANGSGDIPSFTAINNSATAAVAIITVTPTVNGCLGLPKTFKITVNPTPDVVQPPNQNLCSGGFTSAINFSGPVSGTVYTWSNTTPSIGLAISGTGNIPAFQVNGSLGILTTATITVNPSANGCTAPSKTFSINITPVSDVAQPVNQAVCNGATINAILFTGSVAGTTFSWTNNNTAIGLAGNGTGNIGSFVAINLSSSPITATITVKPGAVSCAGPSKTFTITVNPTPAVVASNNVTVCLGNTTQISATGATQYTWSPVDHLSCTNCANPIAMPVDSILYKVRGTNSFGCEAFDSVLLNVIKPFKMQVLPGDSLCFGESLNLQALKANSYLWSPPTGLNRTNISNPTAKPAVTTKYQVIGFDGHNCFTDTGYVLITVGPKPHVNLGPDRTLSTGSPLALYAATDGGPIISWLWTPAADLSCNNCPAPTTIVANNSYYSVVVKNNFGCIATDTIFINSFCKSAQVFIPNAFTPDGDGLNDVLMVRGRGVTIKSFRIFNRWGELVFEKENFYPNDLKFAWDGKVRGIPATPDVFVYTAEVFCDNGVPYTYKGNITLLK